MDGATKVTVTIVVESLECVEEAVYELDPATVNIEEEVKVVLGKGNPPTTNQLWLRGKIWNSTRRCNDFAVAGEH